MKKKYISIVLGVFIAMTPAFASNAPFTDLTEHWGAYELLALYERGIVKGYSDTLMMPNETYTNAQAIVMVSRAVLSDQEASDGTWYEPAYRYALEAKWIEPLTQAELMAPITREALIELLYKVFKSFDASNESPSVLPVLWAKETGLLLGKTDGVLDIEAHLTRAEGGVFMHRFIQKYSDQLTMSSEVSDVTLSTLALDDNRIELTLAWGEKPTGGYRISIREIVFENGKTVVYFSTRSPGPDEMVTQAITYPKDRMVVNIEDLTMDDVELVRIPW